MKLGLIVKPPLGFHFELALRSSAPLKYGVTLPNGFGLIDPSYCGPEDELKLILARVGYGKRSTIKRGDRVAQLILRHSLYCPSKIISGPPVGKSRGGLGSTGEN